MPNRSMVWKVVSYGAGAAAMLATRRVMAVVWKGTRGEEPPDGIASVRAPWVDVLSWAVATGAGVGVARIVAIKSAARVWEATVHEPPPGAEG